MAEAVVRLGVPRIRRDRRTVRRLRTVHVLPLFLQQEAEDVVRVGVPRIRRDQGLGLSLDSSLQCDTGRVAMIVADLMNAAVNRVKPAALQEIPGERR